MQTETVLRQALTEGVRVALLVNKLDRAVFETQLDPEQIYRALSRVIENVNAILATYGETDANMVWTRSLTFCQLTYYFNLT